jgi:hypothetical protein
MLVPWDEDVDEPLFKGARQEAAQWGADRFAAEFDRREEEERRLRDAEAGIFFRYPGVTYASDVPPPEMMSGPVDQAVGDRVVEAVAGEQVEIRKPKPIPHAHVPRPPRHEKGSGRRHDRRRRREERAPAGSWVPSEAELARMSPAGRRLYGVDDDSDRRAPAK